MVRKLSWLLVILFLTACGGNSNDVQPQPICPTCAALSPCPSAAPLPTATPIPTNTTEPTATAVPATETPLPAPQVELPIVADAQFTLESRFPILVKNFAHPEKACNWLGIGGQVLTVDNQPVDNVVLVVSGLLGTTSINAVALSGTSVDYGPGGFEVELADKPFTSLGELYLQLFDLNGTALSNPVTVNTSADCMENLVLVNFQKK